MGVWGYAPWDSDSAADWYGDLFDEVPLAERVEQTLKLDPDEYADEIRAAAAMLILLGRTYVWPVNDIDRHLALAIEQMGKVQAFYAEEDEEEIARAVGEEIGILKSRLANQKDSASLPQPESWGDFWN